MESPAKFSSAHVKRANIAGWCGKRLRVAAANDDQIFEDNARTGEHDGVGAGGLAPQIFAQIDTPVAAEFGNRFSGCGIKRIQVMHYAHQNPSSCSGAPIGQAAIRLRAFYARIKFPN